MIIFIIFQNIINIRHFLLKIIMNKVLIGTHNSCAYIKNCWETSKGSFPASILSWIPGPNLIYNQNLSIKEQLMSGVRVFDFKIRKEGTQYVVHHEVTLCPFKDVLDDLLEFYKTNTPEKVHFRIEDSSESLNEVLNEFPEEDRQLLIKHIDVLKNDSIWINTKVTSIFYYKDFLFERIKEKIYSGSEETLVVSLIYSQEWETLVPIYVSIGSCIVISAILVALVDSLFIILLVLSILSIFIATFFTSNYFNSILFNGLVADIVELLKSSHIKDTIILIDYIKRSDETVVQYAKETDIFII